jgi:galactose mutarotase-like enzyme
MNTQDFERISKEWRSQTELHFSKGEDSLLVRQTGAMIRQLKLSSVEILTTGTRIDPDKAEQPMKIDAAHTMLPVGPSELGTQHGPSRYLDYEVVESSDSTVRLHAVDPLRNLGHTKTIELLGGSAVVTDEVENLNDTEMGISVGEHFYFKVAEQDLAGIELADEDGGTTRLQGHDIEGGEFDGGYAEALEVIRDGGTVHVESYDGSQLIDIPGIGRIKLIAQAETSSGEAINVDLHVWHRPGSDTVAFEPAAGFRDDDEGPHNDGIKLAPGETVQLRSEIRLVS